jgi:hypothetical protein
MYALTAIATGGNNTVMGVCAGDAVTVGSGSVFLGYYAGSTVTTGNNNIAVGNDAMNGAVTTGDNNIAIGASAGDALTSAAGTIAIGTNALGALTTGTGNIAIGYSALDANTIGTQNTAVGYQSLTTNIDGSANTAFGYNSLQYFEADTVNHGHNTSVGYYAGRYISTGTHNTFIGSYSGTGISGTKLEGNLNATLGFESGLLLQGAAAYNTCIGARAGDVITTGTTNTCVGYAADTDDATATNQIVIGYSTTGHGDNIAVIGNASCTAWHPADDNGVALGSSSYRFSDVFAVQTTTGGIFEVGLRTKNIGDNPTGTIVVWREDGLIPCNKNKDELIMGVIKNGKDEPIVLGAEPVLVTGKVRVGDYIVTSNKTGHGKSIKRGYLLKKDLFGKVIAQALEKSDDSDSCLIKCMIRKM